MAYVFVVPQALRVLFSFQTEAIQPFITYDNYFGFVLQVVLALGISFELPLVIIILAWLERDRPGGAGTGSAATRSWPRSSPGAVLSPGTDLVSMIMMTIPLLLLYEVGYAGAVVIQRRRRKAAAMAGLVLLGARARRRAGAEAQVPVQQRPAAGAAPAARRTRSQDTTRKKPGPGARQRHRRPARHPHRAHPELRARRLGAQRRSRPARAISATRYRADSATVFIQEQRVLLQGQALTERQGAHARGGHHPLPARQLPARRERRARTCSTGARCWWARASATTPAGGAGS